MNEAKAIRAALKAELGVNSRTVSVRNMGGAIRIKIKSADVAKGAVSDIAHRFEHVRRCEMSGDILAGGNMFVFVDYASSVVNPLIAEALAILENLETIGLPVVWRGLEMWIDRFGQYWACEAGQESGAETLWYDAQTSARIAALRSLG